MLPGGQQAMHDQVGYGTAGDLWSTHLQEVSKVHIEMRLNNIPFYAQVNGNTPCQQNSYSSSHQHGLSAK